MVIVGREDENNRDVDVEQRVGLHLGIYADKELVEGGRKREREEIRLERRG